MDMLGLLAVVFRSRRQLVGIIIIMLLFWSKLSGLDPDKPVDHYLLDQWEIAEGIPANTINSITLCSLTEKGPFGLEVQRV